MCFQLILTLWVGQLGPAGERQEDPSKDQEVQDQTRTDATHLPGGEREAHAEISGCGSAAWIIAFCYTLWSCGSLQDEEPFNPDYVEVDRILDESHSVDKDNGEVGVQAAFKK